MTCRIRLGDWICPSGNSVDVYYRCGLGRIELEWDPPPPLRPEDEVFYLAVVQPAIIRLVQEYTERPGRALVIHP